MASDVVESYLSKQFVLWLTVFAPAFAFTAAALEYVSAPPFVAFIGGIVFGEVAGGVLRWFKDWWESEQEMTLDVE